MLNTGSIKQDSENEDLEPQMPPWDEASRSQRLYFIFLKICIYIPVLVLWCMCLAVYLIFIFYYLIPNIDYTSSRPELYYWHSSSEYESAKVKAWTVFGFLTLFLILLLISIVRAMATSPGTVPEKWLITSQLSADVEKRQDGNERVCIRCEMKKPDRTHHCRQCEKCVLKMDHHCNWIANCVGYLNYKYFICVLVYGILSTGLIVFTFWETVTITLNDDNNGIFFCHFIVLYYSVCCMIFSVLTAFTSFHFWMMWNNFSTIEYCEKRKKYAESFKTSPFSLGGFENMKQALGKNWVFWLVPTNFEQTSDGTTFLNKTVSILG